MIDPNAWAAATQAGAALGVDPAVLYGQFAGETGNFTNSGAKGYNYASIMPNGQMATYPNPFAFSNAFVNLIQKNYPNAIGAGSDVNKYVAGLTNGRIGTYYSNPPGMAPETQSHYAAMITSQMPSDTPNSPSVWGAVGKSISDWVTNPAANTQAIKDVGAQAVQSVAGKFANYAVIGFGALLVAGAIFISQKSNVINLVKTAAVK
jgi:hypothetical protein